MGESLAPTLAIACIAKIGAPDFKCRLLYCRHFYIGLMVCATQMDMDKCSELLSGQSKHTKLTWEKTTEGSHSLLELLGTYILLNGIGA